MDLVTTTTGEIIVNNIVIIFILLMHVIKAITSPSSLVGHKNDDDSVGVNDGRDGGDDSYIEAVPSSDKFKWIDGCFNCSSEESKTPLM